jgi:hypothetical protein
MSLDFTQDTNILEDHYARNRHPRPPLSAMLQDWLAPNHRNATPTDADKSDDAAQLHRQKCNSVTVKQDHCTDPTQLAFYSAKWTDFLEECNVETRTYAAVHEPWPHSKQAMVGFILDVIEMTIMKWR